MRGALGEAEQTRASEAVCARILAMDAYKAARCVMAYVAARGELSLAPVIAHALSSGKTLALPRCEGEGMMTARRVADLAQLERGSYGLMEPGESCPVIPPREIDLILAPGTAFDDAGHRVGQGGGYYDRFLPKTRALRVGVCHDFERLARVPHTDTDCDMDAVIAPSSMRRCKEHTDGGRA